MSLHLLLQQRAAGQPARVGLIGAGKFGSMFLNQVPTMPGLEVSVIADLDPERARAACRNVGCDAARIARTAFVASGIEACADPAIEVIAEATGSPPAGIAHARAAIAAKKHIVMVNVEADVLAGPLLAEEARARGVVDSLAYGDQPALTCELVDRARACGFEVVVVGKGTKYLPAYHAATPADVWAHYGLTPDEAQSGGMNPQMFNSASASIAASAIGSPNCDCASCGKRSSIASRRSRSWGRRAAFIPTSSMASGHCR